MIIIINPHETIKQNAGDIRKDKNELKRVVNNLIDEGKIVPVDVVLAEYKKIQRLYVGNIETRGWLLDVLNCINSIRNDIFSLGDIYAFESLLRKLHPNNNNVKEKIRQQLQFLRDRGFVEFIDNKGHYKKI